MNKNIKQGLAGYLRAFITGRRQLQFSRVLADRTHHVRVVLDTSKSADACAVMRSCECFGIQNLDLISDNRYKLHPGVALGASKWLSISQHKHHPTEGAAPHLAQLKAKGYRIVAVSTRPSSLPIDVLPLDDKFALVMGGSRGQFSADHMADVQATIPAVGFTKTLNISVVAALCLASISNRLHASEIPWRLTAEERLDLELVWLANMPKRIKKLVTRFLHDQQLQSADLETVLLPAARERMLD